MHLRTMRSRCSSLPEKAPFRGGQLIGHSAANHRICKSSCICVIFCLCVRICICVKTSDELSSLKKGSLSEGRPAIKLANVEFHTIERSFRIKAIFRDNQTIGFLLRYASTITTSITSSSTHNTAIGDILIHTLCTLSDKWLKM